MTESLPESPVVLSTSVAVAGGLLGGFLVGRLTERRSVTGLVLGGVGLLVGTQWVQNRGLGTAAVLGSVYVAAIQLANPFAAKLGRLPIVVAASGAAAMAAYTLHDKHVTVGLDPAEQPTDSPD